MSNPLISVIMPAHNSAQSIKTAIDSIIAQTYRNLEIIVVDDFSTDNTKDVILGLTKIDPRIHYYALTEDDPDRFDPKLQRNINAGYSARNFGFTQCHGELITFQDADDASLLNRLEIQLGLLEKYKATHICTTTASFDEKKLGTTFDLKKHPDAGKLIADPQELYRLSQKTKGLVAKISPALNSRIPFHFKRLKILNKLFFGSLAPYPGAGNSPLFKREVIDKVSFRKLSNRIWPSFMGRGADRDFNFQVAETFKNSYVFDFQLYMWSREVVVK
ncbi:MAG: glycosyltransferase family 2 protein [Candidatus Paceibacterota bacterium]|jgi:glycosyltransferase involved in cell wall biosynthesis